MLALFALRLALGCLLCLFLLSPARSARAARAERAYVHPNFFRTLLLTVLGLECLAGLFLYPQQQLPVLIGLGIALFGAFVGSAVWSLENSPGAVTLLLLTTAGAAVALVGQEIAGSAHPTAAALDGLASAALLGAAVTAMLLGHNYLIAPSMSLSPLFRLLAALAIALLVRMVVDGLAGAWHLASAQPPGTMTADTTLWLPVRWVVGFVIPLALTWMAWQTARIRSTQSATGILYVVVICCFLGELTALLLRDSVQGS